MKQNLPLDVYEALDETRLLLEGFQPAVLIFTYHSLPKQLRVVADAVGTCATRHTREILRL